MNEETFGLLNSEIKALVNDIGLTTEVKSQADEEIKAFNIDLDSPEAALLIGFHGETLQSLQLIFSFLVHKLTGEWYKVSVDVGDYKQKREEQLRNLALNLAAKAKISGEAQTIPNLNANERRLIHLALSDNPDVVSESEGEGRQRVLVIKPKK
ncbi:KH domain-containing protein [Candidatus Microgenomates bacterium]|jgi:spoIIIJ-associated protein|nr:MAG: KH domain-containing protein [Candidatus Microgenomates bacterium]